MKAVALFLALFITFGLNAQTSRPEAQRENTTAQQSVQTVAKAKESILYLSKRLDKALEIADAETVAEMRTDILTKMDIALELQPNAELQKQRKTFAEMNLLATKRSEVVDFVRAFARGL